MKIFFAVSRSVRLFSKSALVSPTRTIGRITGTSNFHTVNTNPRSISVDMKNFSVVVEHVKSSEDSFLRAVLLSWNKKTGDAIAEDDVIAVVETDKVTMEIRAKKAGVFVEGMVSAQGEIAVGTPLYKMDASATAAADTAKPAAAPTKAAPASPGFGYISAAMRLLFTGMIETDRNLQKLQAKLQDEVDAKKAAAKAADLEKDKEGFRFILRDMLSVYLNHVVTPQLRVYKNNPTLTCENYLAGATNAACIKFLQTLSPDDPRRVLLDCSSCPTDLTERYKVVDAATKSFGNVSIQKIYEIAARLEFEKKDKYFANLGVAQPSEEDFGDFLTSTYNFPHTEDEEPELLHMFKKVQNALSMRNLSLCNKFGY